MVAGSSYECLTILTIRKPMATENAIKILYFNWIRSQLKPDMCIQLFAPHACVRTWHFEYFPLNAAKVVLIISWINSANHKSRSVSLALFHFVVEMSLLSSEWLSRSSMWCDSQPGSQPPISANGLTYLQGWGLWGSRTRAILTGSFACLPSHRQESGWKGATRE